MNDPVEVEILDVEQPVWNGNDQVDPLVYRMRPKEKESVRKLASYLPRLQGVSNSSEDSRLELVGDFFSVAAKVLPPVDYTSYPIQSWLSQPDFLTRAQFPQLHIVLVWMTRGERFCDGFWRGLLEDGRLIRLIDRLAQLAT